MYGSVFMYWILKYSGIIFKLSTLVGLLRYQSVKLD